MLQDTLASGMVFTSTGQCLRWHTAASHLYSVYTTCHVRRRVRQAARRQCCHSAAAGNTARTVEASSTPGYRIRAATPEDVQRLCKIEQLCDEYSAGWGEAEIQVCQQSIPDKVIQQRVDLPHGALGLWAHTCHVC